MSILEKARGYAKVPHDDFYSGDAAIFAAALLRAVEALDAMVKQATDCTDCDYLDVTARARECLASLGVTNKAKATE